MTPRFCHRCFTYVPKASRCPHCGSRAFVRGTPLAQPEPFPFVLMRKQKRALVVGEALNFDPLRKPIYTRGWRES